MGTFPRCTSVEATVTDQRRVVLYCRVSTSRQETDGTSLDTQEEKGLRYLTEVKGVPRDQIDVYKEVYTGANLLDRPDLSKIRGRLWQGEVRLLCPYAVDRLARNQVHMAILLDQLEQVHCELDFVIEDFSDDPFGRYMLTTMAFLAEL